LPCSSSRSCSRAFSAAPPERLSSRLSTRIATTSPVSSAASSSRMIAIWARSSSSGYFGCPGGSSAPRRPPDQAVTFEQRVEVLPDRLRPRKREDGLEVVEGVGRIPGDVLGLGMAGIRLDVDQLPVDRDVCPPPQKRPGCIGERLVVEVAPVREGPLLVERVHLNVVVEERAPGRRVRVRALAGVLLRKCSDDVVDVAQRHRLEGDGKARRAARRKRHERVVGADEVVAASTRRVGVPVGEVEDVAVARFPDDPVEELDRLREAGQIGGSDPEVELVDVRRVALEVVAHL
jgi:hypothetical protein